MPHTEINSKNVKDFVKCIKDDKVIVFYHMNNCGYCRELMPIWKDAIKKSGDKSYIIDIEYLMMNKLPDNYKVSGFPSIIVYNKGKYFDDYKDKRTIENLEKFIKKHNSDKL